LAVLVLLFSGFAEDFPALPEYDGQHGQGADRISPPLVKQEVEADTGQQASDKYEHT
jgi:hypothetical protein